jgi:peptide-methionine (S)-S-oxide reductase
MTEKATFAAGCFWGVEAAFRQVPGVRRTTVGYTGGTLPNATYEQVCSGTTGHAEAVEVEFDPTEVSYEQLLETFWASHNPTQRNRQGWDIGTQYRSGVFFHTPEQQEAATRSRDEHQRLIEKPIVTEITPAAEFWPAEDYHQRYLEKRGRASCAVGVADAEQAQPSWLSTVAARLGGRD